MAWYQGWTRADVEFYGKLFGGILAILGLGATAYQIAQAKNALISANEQAIYRESREILKFLTENPELLRMMQLSDTSKLNDDDRIRLDAQVGWILNFYNSSLRDGATEVTADFRTLLRTDFCRLARFPQILARLKAENPKQPYFALSSIRQKHCNV